VKQTREYQNKGAMKQGNNKEGSNEARECKFLEFFFSKLAIVIFKSVKQKLHVTIEQ
jgi:hypothetical protein